MADSAGRNAATLGAIEWPQLTADVLMFNTRTENNPQMSRANYLMG
jgi:hypothetical protein